MPKLYASHKILIIDTKNEEKLDVGQTHFFNYPDPSALRFEYDFDKICKIVNDIFVKDNALKNKFCVIRESNGEIGSFELVSLTKIDDKKLPKCVRIVKISNEHNKKAVYAINDTIGSISFNLFENVIIGTSKENRYQGAILKLKYYINTNFCTVPDYDNLDYFNGPHDLINRFDIVLSENIYTICKLIIKRSQLNKKK